MGFNRRNPKPETRNPKPTAKVGFNRRNPKPETRNPKPTAKVGFNRRNPKPETRNRQQKWVSIDETFPEPETRNRQQKWVSIDETRNPKPETDSNPTFGWLSGSELFLMMFGDGSPLGIQPPAENDLMNCMHGQEQVSQDLSYRSHVHHCLSTYHFPSIWLVAPCFLLVVSWFYSMLNTVPTTLNILACYESRLGHPESLCFPTFGSAVLTIFCTTTPTMPSKN